MEFLLRSRSALWDDGLAELEGLMGKPGEIHSNATWPQTYGPLTESCEQRFAEAFHNAERRRGLAKGRIHD